MSDVKAVQDLICKDDPIRGCFGCGADNPEGLRIKSFVEGDEGIARWRAQEHHQAYPGFLNGGIAATLIDCHSACTAAAMEGRERGIDLEKEPERFPPGWTRALSVEFLKPVPIDKELTLRARVVKKGKKSRTIACSIYVDGEECVRGEVVMVMVEA